jgi:transposase
MLQLTPQMRILVAVQPVDFRKGIDSLAELCRAKLNTDPFSGCLFVFRSRRATSIKVLVYDGQGFWLATKRLSKGRFRWWPQVAVEGTEERTRVLRVHQASPIRGWQPRCRCRSRVAADPVKEAE